jgi:predicted protein tyrosine phosphatase
LRSPTAERVFFETPGIEVRSAGTERDAEQRVSRDDVEWADLILVMERRHAKRLRELMHRNAMFPRVVSLDIPDEYEFVQPELIALLEQKVTPFLQSAINAARLEAQLEAT